MSKSLLLLLLCALPVIGAEGPPDTVRNGKKTLVKPRAKAEKPPPRRILYRPPQLGSPRVSTGPGARGSSDTALVLAVLAPDHVGLTTAEQPCLFWYQSRSTKRKMELTLVAGREPEPLLSIPLEEAPSGHLQRLDLVQHKIRLQLGVRYLWSVAAIPDQEHRSKDLVASGVLERVPEPETLQRSLAAAEEWEKPYIYAQGGMWYDAVENLASLAAKEPRDPQWLETWASLSHQTGLTNVAQHLEQEAREIRSR